MAPIDGDPMGDVLSGSSPPPSPVPSSPAQVVPSGPAPHIEGPQQPIPPQLPPAVMQPEPGRDRPERMVPLPELLDTRHRLQSERARAEDLARQNEQLVEALSRFASSQQQPQAPPPPPPQIDPNLDPAGAYQQLQAQTAAALQHMQAQTQMQLLNQHLNTSEREARRAYGDAVVDRALDAALSQGYADTFRNQADPYASMVSWHQANELAREVGSDPRAYRERIRHEERQRLIAEMRGGAPPPSNIPPSIASATRSADGAPMAVQGSKDFFNSMLANPRGNRGPGGQR